MLCLSQMPLNDSCGVLSCCPFPGVISSYFAYAAAFGHIEWLVKWSQKSFERWLLALTSLQRGGTEACHSWEGTFPVVWRTKNNWSWFCNHRVIQTSKSRLVLCICWHCQVLILQRNNSLIKRSPIHIYLACTHGINYNCLQSKPHEVIKIHSN